MIDAIVLEFAGRRVRVVARTAAARPALERVARVFARFREDGPRADVELAVYEGGDDPAGRTVVAVSTAALAAAPERWALHAAACTWNDRTLVLPGGSGRGKSTLVAHLVRCGATLLSDEVAWLEPPDFAVHPFPRAILVDDAGTVAEIPEGRVATTSAPAPAVVVFPSFEPGAAPLLSPLSRARATAGLLELTLHAPEPGPAAPLDLAVALVRDTPCFAAVYGTSDDAVALLERALSTSAPA